MTSKQALPQNESQSIEARAVADGFMDANGFFTMSDNEFEIQSMGSDSRQALAEVLAKPGMDHETAAFLRDFMRDSADVHFEPFSD